MDSATRLLLATVVLCSLGACRTSESDDPRPSCEADLEIPAGELHATVEGEDWLGTALSYQVAATGLFVSFTADATNGMTLRLVQSTVYDLAEDDSVVTSEGPDIQTVWDDQLAPTDFELGDTNRDGADVTLVLDSETLHTSEGDGGFLRLTSFDADETTGAVTVRGCFSFHAGAQTGDAEATVDAASFALPAQ